MTSKAVTIYHDYDYGGASQELPVGAYTHADSGLANAVSALKIPEGMVVTLWSSHDFTGEKHVLRQSTPRLSNFNDKTRSLLVALDEPGFASSLHFAGSGRKISFAKNGFPLNYHSVLTYRMQHLQDMLRLPDADGKQYYMGTYSQNCSDTEGGMVFVGELNSVGKARVIWCDVLSNSHQAGGYNHPGDLRRLGDVVVIAGQNWDSRADANKGFQSAGKDGDLLGAALKASSWWGQTIDKVSGEVTEAVSEKLLGKKVDPVLGETFNLGKGNFQYVLFYDVSSPAEPKYMGKMNSCVDAKNDRHTLSGEIDRVSVAKAGEYYYLSFGRGGGGLKCRSKKLSPDASWELVELGSDESAGPVTFMLNGTMVVGRARLEDSNKVVLEKLSFTPGGSSLLNSTTKVSRTDVMTSFIPGYPFGSDSVFNLTALGNGETSVVITDVESKGTIDICEVSGAYGPITALYLLFNESDPPAGYAKIPVNLNRKAKGDDIYLCYTRDPSKGSPITDIRIDIKDDEETTAPSGYQTIAHSPLGSGTPDLNRNAGGDYVYMYYRTDEAAGVPIRNIAILDGENASADPGWKVIRKDLNEDAKGDYLYLQFTRH